MALFLNDALMNSQRICLTMKEGSGLCAEDVET